ncbi:c-type cytochrome, partial [Escherichia coli]|nr:c-type cytochrome [Escherichia coli]
MQKAAAQEALTQDLSMDELMAQGEAIYSARCAVCHQANGEGIPGAFPSIKGSPVATGDVTEHIGVVVDGRAGTAMQSFANQLSDQ